MILESLQQRLRDLQALHAVTYEQVNMARKQMMSLDMVQLADCAYVLNEASKLADDLRKECKGLSETLQKIACARWVTTGDGEPIRGELCTATPQIKEMRQMPKSGTPEYSKLMAHFGVIDDTLPIHPHWPAMVEYLTSRTEQGLPPPPGMEGAEVYQQCSLTMRRKS